MSAQTAEARALREVIIRHRAQINAVLKRYGAHNPSLFGPIARGDSTASSDIDLMVDLDPGGGSALLRVAGIAEVLSELLGMRVDVVTETLLRNVVLVRSVQALSRCEPRCRERFGDILDAIDRALNYREYLNR